QPAAVVEAVRLRERGMVQVIPRDETVGRFEHRLRLLAVTPAVLRVLREHRDRLQQATGRKAVNADLAAEATGEECVQLVVLTGSDIHTARIVAGAGQGRGAPAGAG